jgi:hypothetical protein
MTAERRSMPMEMTWWGWLLVATVLAAAEVALVIAVCRAAASSTRRPEAVPVRVRVPSRMEGRRRAS